MQYPNLGNVREGMNVCDRNGDKIGTIKMIHQVSRSVGGVTPTTNEGYLHIDSGFLGLGKDYYVPFSAIRDCSSDCCFLNVDKNDIDRMGWDQKPTNLL